MSAVVSHLVLAATAIVMFVAPSSRAADAGRAAQKPAQRPEAVLNALVKRYSKQEIFWLDIQEQRRFRLNSGVERTIRLVSVNEHRDSVVHLMRRAEIGVEIDGRPLELVCEPYTMPTQTAGLRILADTTSGWNEDMLPKRVQFSAWDAADPIVDVKRFGFPIRNYRLFSHGTQAYNEVVHLGRGDDDPAGQRFYHNYGMDMAGFERREEIVSATDGKIVRFFPSRERVSAINVQDGQGHFWNYEHLDSTFLEVVVGAPVARGHRLGMLGKTGPSGEFSHLHLGWLGHLSRHVNLYPWLVAAYQAEHPKRLYAVARPHHTVLTGETVEFDGSKSLAFGTKIVSWRWEFHDGRTVHGTKTRKVFDRPGAYIASLWVKDETGAEDVDFCQIKVFSRANPESGIPTVFMTYKPTEEIRADQPVLFRFWFQGHAPRPLKVDFGDGTHLADYASYSEVTHRFLTPGIHIVTAQCDAEGKPITNKQKVIVEDRLAGVPVLSRAPSCPAELIRALAAYPEMTGFARDAEVIDNGLQTLTYGEHLPLGPAPATPWARPLPGGPLKLVMIGQTANCYDLAEVERRVDCQVRFVHLPDQYYFAKTYPEAVAGYFSTQAIRTLEHEADVILADPLVRILSPQAAQAIQRKVQAGCGLVLFPVARWGGGGQFGYWPSTDQGGAWKDWFAPLIKSAAPARYVAQHSVTSSDGLWEGVPWSLLPAHYVAGLTPAGSATVLAKDGDLPLAVGAAVGKGRVALLPWGTYMGCFPLAEDNKPERIRDYQEYYASAILRVLLWAANRPSPVAMSLASGRQQAGVAGTAQIAVRGAVLPGGKLELRLRDLLCRDLWQNNRPLAAGTVEIQLPALAAGDYLLDAIARDAHGSSLGWGTWVLLAVVEAALSVSLDRDVYQPGQPATITAQVARAPVGDCIATLQVWDALDRLLQEETQPVVAGRARWTFANRDPLCVLHYADVQIRRNGLPYLASRTELFVPRFTFPDFHNCLWGAWLPNYATRRIDRRLREAAGFDIMLCGGYGGSHTAGNYRHLASGMIPFYTNVACVSPAEVELNPDRAQREAAKSVEGCLPELKRFGAAAIFFQDERHGLEDPGKLTEEGLAAFRQWLKRRYPAIAALNAAWGRQYPSFDEVKPLLTKEFDPQREPSLAPWLEWRLWNIDRVVQIDRANAHRIREHLGHDAWMGLEGIFGGGHNYPYGGLDLAAQGDDCFNAAAPYSETLMNACQSFYSGPSFSWNGYGNPYPVYQRYVWARALQGDWSLGWFCGNTFYSPRDGFLPQIRWVADLTRPLREGVGKLLAEHRPFQRDPVAFLYSQPSLYAMRILGKTIDPANPHLMGRPAEWAQDSLQRMFNDAGVQFGYLSEKQLQQGRAKGIRLLVLSSCVALEPATCAALEQFVADGGILLADLPPGVWDGHGVCHSPGQLDRLFGVKRTDKFAFKAMPADWSVGVFEAEPDFILKNDWLIGQFYEKTLQVADGHALGKHILDAAKTPAFVFKRTGKGAAILMDYLETEYRRVPEHSQQNLAAALLKLAGIAPPVTLYNEPIPPKGVRTPQITSSKGPDPFWDRLNVAKQGEPITAGVKIMRWQDGPTLYVGILLDQGQKTQVALPRTGHLYDLASGGRYLGHGNSATLDLRDSPHALVAVLPYKVEGASLHAGPSRLGQDLPLEFGIQISGGQPVRHVVHLDVFRPDGTKHYDLSRNFVFRDGRWRGTLPLALNDPEGPWTIRAREVCSAVSSEVKVQVQK